MPVRKEKIMVRKKTMNLVKDKYDVMVVDDNFDQANIMKLLIEQYGFRTKFSTSSRLAYQNILRHKPRLVILDLMMPEIDGLKLCKMLKENPDTSDIKIIIYSGKLYESDRRKAMMLGADLFLTKPTRSHVLLNSIRSLIHPLVNESVPS
jgi:CheY-like chemotaxis protein